VHLAGRGVPTGGVFIPRRCSHSPSEVIDLRDLDQTADLLSSFLGSLDVATVEGLASRPIQPLATGLSDRGVD
jgi:putative aminopeptidase FrvX